MRATTIHAPGDIRLTDVPDPTIEAPTDAIVRVVAGCICGSDLWPYRGANPITAGSTIGHEAVGVAVDGTRVTARQRLQRPRNPTAAVAIRISDAGAGTGAMCAETRARSEGTPPIG